MNPCTTQAVPRLQLVCIRCYHLTSICFVELDWSQLLVASVFSLYIIYILFYYSIYAVSTCSSSSTSSLDTDDSLIPNRSSTVAFPF